MSFDIKSFILGIIFMAIIWPLLLNLLSKVKSQ